MASGAGGFDRPGKPDPLKLQPPIGKKPHKKRERNYGMRRGDAFKRINALGSDVAKAPDVIKSLPKVPFPEEQQLDFFGRAFDDTGKRAKSETFGSRYRSTWGAQDELLSTASVRHLIDGLLAGRTRDTLPAKDRALLSELIDLMSTLRIPTRYSGFSTATEVMQHPTEEGEGFFSAEAVFGQHGTYDSARVKYIGDAVNQAAEDGADVAEQIRVAARAAIEFSLNYFTAPVTASNVQPFSTKKGVSSTDPALLDQIAARERIKEIYVQLGGTLRTLQTATGEVLEEPEDESITRPWQQGLPITATDPQPFAPPSPRRERRKKKEEPKSSAKTPLTAPSGDAPKATGFGSSLFSATPSQASSSTRTTPALGSTYTGSVPYRSLSQPIALPPAFVGMVRVRPLNLEAMMRGPLTSRSLLDDVLTGVSIGVRAAEKRARSELEIEDESPAKRQRLREPAADDPFELRVDLDGLASEPFGVLASPSAPPPEEEALALRDAYEPMPEDEEVLSQPLSSVSPQIDEFDLYEELYPANAPLPEADWLSEILRAPSPPSVEDDAETMELSLPSVPTTDPFAEMNAFEMQFPAVPTTEPFDMDAFLTQFPTVPTHVPGAGDVTGLEGSAATGEITEGGMAVGEAATSSIDALAVLLV